MMNTLTYRIKFESFDDIDAREKAKKIIDNHGLNLKDCKLQEVYDKKPPRNIVLSLKDLLTK